jgi:hypothetical protein
MRPDDVEFCLIVERGPLEAQAILLCESIRAFAGRYAQSRITAVSPRPDWRPADRVRQRLLELGVEYRAENLISPTPEYGPSYRVLTAGMLGREAGPPVLVQLDSDTIFVGEPDLELGDDLLLARPVDETGMCSTGPDDPRDAYWQLMCRANGVGVDALGWVETSVGCTRVRTSYNGGFIAGRRALFAETEAVFERIVASGLRSWPGHERGERIGAGTVGARGYAWWGTSQAAISIAAARLSGTRRLLDAGHNVPLHLISRVDQPPQRAAHLHYHWLFADQGGAEGVIERLPSLGVADSGWLRERLPLVPRMVEGIGVFSPQPLLLPPLEERQGDGPACSVVMTVYQDTRFLQEAVSSVLAQDFTDFELIVVDDGSDDPAPVAALAALDPRIKTIHLEKNRGTAEAANQGVAASRGRIIARLDCDDAAEPGWLGRVVGALRADPGLGLVGTAVTLVDVEGNRLGVQPMPESDFAIRFTMLFHNPFYHSTTAYRRELFDAAGGYRADQPVSQDRYLWFAMLPLSRAKNLPEPLVRYRVNPSGLTSANASHDPRGRTAPIRVALWREIGIPPPLARLAIADEADNFLRGRPPADPDAGREARDIVDGALRRLEAISGDFVRPGEEAAARLFAASLRQRLAAGPVARRSLPKRAIARALKLAPASLAVAVLRRARRVLERRAGMRGRAAGTLNPVIAAFHDVSPYLGFDPAPYPQDLQGWGSDDLAFRRVIAELRPSLIVEVGSWKGASAIHMASLCREFGLQTAVICIDTWLGSSEHVLGLRANARQSLQLRHGFPQLYYTFLANVVRSGFADMIVPLANTSDTAAIVLREKGLQPDLVYLDASHDEDSVLRDLKAYWGLLRPGGVILGDDFAKYPGVRRAAQAFAAEAELDLVDYGDKFVLRRPPPAPGAA